MAPDSRAHYAPTMERSDAAETRERGDRRSLFDRFVQTAYLRVSWQVATQKLRDAIALEARH